MSSEVDIGEISYWSGRSAAHHIDAKRLRERAAEIRARRSAPTYASQPKPDAVRTGQWWMWAADSGNSAADPFRIDVKVPRFKSDGPRVIGVYLSDRKIGSFEGEEFLTDADWLYLGDGPEPAHG